MVSKLYTIATKGLKLKVRKFWELVTTFVEVKGEKLVGGNRVKSSSHNIFFHKVLIFFD